MIELLALGIAVAVGWYWIDTLNAREAALAAAQRACEAEGCQFLDWTVAQGRLGFDRDAGGRLKVRRVYRFEYSDTGNNRLEGSVTLLGRDVLTVRLARPSMPPVAGNVIDLHDLRE
jgi:hypothetical protein